MCKIADLGSDWTFLDITSHLTINYSEWDLWERSDYQFLDKSWTFLNSVGLISTQEAVRNSNICAWVQLWRGEVHCQVSKLIQQYISGNWSARSYILHFSSKIQLVQLKQFITYAIHICMRYLRRTILELGNAYFPHACFVQGKKPIFVKTKRTSERHGSFERLSLSSCDLTHWTSQHTFFPTESQTEFIQTIVSKRCLVFNNLCILIMWMMQ